VRYFLLCSDILRVSQLVNLVPFSLFCEQIPPRLVAAIQNPFNLPLIIYLIEYKRQKSIFEIWNDLCLHPDFRLSRLRPEQYMRLRGGINEMPSSTSIGCIDVQGKRQALYPEYLSTT